MTQVIERPRDGLQWFSRVEELTRIGDLRTHPDLPGTPRIAAFIDQVLSDVPTLKLAL